MSGPAFESLASGLAVAEGPVALPDGTLLFVEVFSGRVSRLSADGAVSLVADTGGGPNGAALGPDGHGYICNNGGISREDLDRFRAGTDDPSLPAPDGRIERVNISTGAVERLYDHCGDTKLLSPNDLVFDTHGGFYFTDFGSVRRLAPQMGHVYYALADGSSIKRVGIPLERPNGVGLSPCGEFLFVSETSTGRVWRFDVVAPGMLRGDDAPSLLFHDPELHLDSLAVQADGCVCVASPNGDCILRVTPDGRGQRIPTPAGRPSNLCFSGADMRTVFITMLGGEIFRAQWDVPGLGLN